MSTFPYPQSIRGQNTHRIILHVEKPRSLVEQAEQAAAEGLLAARRVLAALDDLPPEVARTARPVFDKLHRHLEDRAIFAPVFRDLAAEALAALDGALVHYGRDDSVESPRALLAEAVEASRTVEDYMAAQRAVRAMR